MFWVLGEENPEVCISKLTAFTSSMYLTHPQFYAPSPVQFSKASGSDKNQILCWLMLLLES